MADRRRTSQTQMADLTVQQYEQNQKLKQMLKVANETDQTATNIKGQLGRQGQVIKNNIALNNDLGHQIKMADKKTNEMRRRNLCIKGGLWILIILLFAANIGLIIYKATTIQ